MNLVALEYVASRAEPGVLLLSEFAGCSQSLAGALRVQPWAVGSVCSAMKCALEMKPGERGDRWASLAAYVGTHTSSTWASSFLHQLAAVGADAQAGEVARAAVAARAAAAAVDAAALRATLHRVNGPPRLVCLRHEGVLASPGDPLAVTPGGAGLLGALLSAPNTTVVVVSSSSPALLTSAYAAFPPHLTLVAEDGALVWRVVEGGVGECTPPCHAVYSGVTNGGAGGDAFCTPTGSPTSGDGEGAGFSTPKALPPPRFEWCVTSSGLSGGEGDAPWRGAVLPILRAAVDATPLSVCKEGCNTLTFCWEAGGDGDEAADRVLCALEPLCAVHPLETVLRRGSLLVRHAAATPSVALPRCLAAVGGGVSSCVLIESADGAAGVDVRAIVTALRVREEDVVAVVMGGGGGAAWARSWAPGPPGL